MWTIIINQNKGLFCVVEDASIFEDNEVTKMKIYTQIGLDSEIKRRNKLNYTEVILDVFKKQLK